MSEFLDDCMKYAAILVFLTHVPSSPIQTTALHAARQMQCSPTSMVLKIFMR